MSEWFSVLAVFWVLWALDGWRVLPWRIFTIVGSGVTRSRARIRFARLSLPGAWPASWRMAQADLPLAVSPMGVSNRPTGSAGRPAENPSRFRAWRWEEIREVGVARGWIFVNGETFCADTGHIRATELLELTRAAPADREKRIEALIRLCFRPAHLRRRARVLERRTALPAWLNAIAFAGFVGLTIYVAGDFASRVPAGWSERLAALLPWGLLGLLATHVTAVVTAWRSKRHLRSRAPDKRGSALFSALLLPPQAMRLRASLGDGYFPPQHPLAAVLAFGERRERERYAFNVVADLRWPIEAANDPADAEIAQWYRGCLERVMRPHLAGAAMGSETLLTPPRPDSPASRSYCPRCRDQFVEAIGTCPHGVTLCPLDSTRSSRAGMP